jgi:hypothetical protein
MLLGMLVGYVPYPTYLGKFRVGGFWHGHVTLAPHRSARFRRVTSARQRSRQATCAARLTSGPPTEWTTLATAGLHGELSTVIYHLFRASFLGMRPAPALNISLPGIFSSFRSLPLAWRRFLTFPPPPKVNSCPRIHSLLPYQPTTSVPTTNLL